MSSLVVKEEFLPQLSIEDDKPVRTRFHTKYNKDRKRRILEGLGQGQHPDIAAHRAGITKQTMEKWCRRGHDAGPDSDGIDLELYEFFMEVQQTMAEAEAGILSRILLHVDEDWKAGSWWLEHTKSDRYSKRTIHTGADGGPIKVQHGPDFSKLSDKELDALQVITAKALAAEDVIDAEVVEDE